MSRLKERVLKQACLQDESDILVPDEHCEGLLPPMADGGKNVVPIFPGLQYGYPPRRPGRVIQQRRAKPHFDDSPADTGAGDSESTARAQTDRVSLQALRLFAGVCGTGKASRVAADLDVTISTVSNSIARLRQLFGHELFRSTGRGLEPTALADMVAPRVREILRIWDSIINEFVASALDQGVPQLSVACPEYLLLVLARLPSDALPVDLCLRHPLPIEDEMRRLRGACGAAALIVTDPDTVLPDAGERHVIARFAKRWIVARRGHSLLAESPTMASARTCRWIGIEGSSPHPADEGFLSLESWSSLGQILRDSDHLCFCSDLAAHPLVSEYGLEAYLVPDSEQEPCELQLIFPAADCAPAVRDWLLKVLRPALETWIVSVLEIMRQPVVARRLLRGTGRASL